MPSLRLTVNVGRDYPCNVCPTPPVTRSLFDKQPAGPINTAAARLHLDTTIAIVGRPARIVREVLGPGRISANPGGRVLVIERSGRNPPLTRRWEMVSANQLFS